MAASRPRRRPYSTTGGRSNRIAGSDRSNTASGLRPPRRSARALTWIAGAVGTALIGALITVNIDQVQSRVSGRNPVSVEYGAPTRPPGGFVMVAPDGSRLAPEISRTGDCEQLWDLGIAGGAVPANLLVRPMILRGEAKDGVDITDVRAVVTSRGPAEGQAILACPSAGTVDPIGLSFDLYEVDRARAQRTDPTNPDKRLPQFDEGLVINLKEHEPVSTQVSVQLPEDRITWHFEADIYTGGEKRTVVLNDHGRDFYSPGFGGDYDEGHFSGVESTDWGVDHAAIRVGDHLEYPGFRVPWLDGMDVHQPPPPPLSERNSGYRWIRWDGRQLVRFNPPGVAADQPAQGELSTPLPGSDIVLIMAAGLTADDQVRARRIVAEASAVPSPVPLLTQEPVATLPEEARPALPGAETATDVGYITEVYQDIRGTVIQFDKVTYRHCSCPGGAEVTNENPRVRTLLLGTEGTTITIVSDDGVTRWDLNRGRDTHLLVALSRTPSGELTSLVAREPRG